MLWAVWVGLAIAVLTVAFGIYRAVRQALGMFRALRALKGETAGALERLAQSAERLAEHPDAAARLQPALRRLARDRAQLNVLLAAVDEVRDSVTRVTSVYPRK
jgi:uncharacterized protein HemX